MTVQSRFDSPMSAMPREAYPAARAVSPTLHAYFARQAANLGDRLIMMHRGQIIHDFQGAEKRRLRPDDLLARFEEVRRAEQLDESAAQMLAENYV